MLRALIGKNVGLFLGPLAVKPSYQHKGVGKKLIEYGLKKAKENEFKWIALTGRDYYTKFGFESASDYGIILFNNHPENPYFKIKFLGTSEGVYGKMRFYGSF